MNNQKREIIKFIKRISVFTLPLILFFGLSTFLLFFSGEMELIDDVIKKQSTNKNVFYGLAYYTPFKYYKYNSAKLRNPEILALGTSRTMQFRSAFFKAAFYNAGGSVEILSHYRVFIENLPKNSNIKVIIAGLDQFCFNANVSCSTDKNEILTQYNSKYHQSSAWRYGVFQIYKDYFNNKFSISQLINDYKKNNIGMNALINHNGFRYDGSYYYGHFIENADKLDSTKFDDLTDGIDKGQGQFVHGSEISLSALEELEGILRLCKERNIHFIGFLPPFAHKIFLKMNAMGDEFKYLGKIYPSIKNIFSKYNFKIYDFSDIDSFGSNDKEMIDGFHGSEKTVLRLFLKMIKDDKVLSSYSKDKDYLAKKINEDENNYQIFANDIY